MILFVEDELRLRELERADKSFLVKWLSDDNVLKYYGGRDNPFDGEKVEEKFYSVNKFKTRCIIEYLEKPIGYIQFYTITEEERSEYGYEDFDALIYGVDLFIGETEYQDRGIGTKLLRLIVKYLVDKKAAEKIVIDPEAWNKRAIRCYEKVGFKKIKLLKEHELHEGSLRDSWLMEYKAMF